MKYPKIDLTQYTYELPENKIAKFPLKDRDASRLLFYHNGNIFHHQFSDITGLIPDSSSLFFNNTRVIPARMLFKKSTGARIEIFLLEPYAPSRVMSENMNAQESVVWSCMVGNAKKWKADQLLNKEIEVEGIKTKLTVKWHDKANQLVQLNWDSKLPFAKIVESGGSVPLPPYIDREVTLEDKPRYQTVYSKIDGAVAAPTAGLHFTPEILAKLKTRNITGNELTLHVSAGTFQPLKTRNVETHPMHSEQVIVSRSNIETLLKSKKVIAVGTTSLRTLESLYWYGIMLQENPSSEFVIEKLFPYQVGFSHLPTVQESMKAIDRKMNKEKLDYLVGHTEIFLFPGYKFQVCEGLVTNFHLPGSTLILLVAAFVGKRWESIYQSALDNDYRFLSYGDSSLLLK